MLLFFFFTTLFVGLYYYLCEHSSKYGKTFTWSEQSLCHTAKSSDGEEDMSDDEFCDPAGADRRYKQLMAQKASGEQSPANVKDRWQHTDAKKAVGQRGGGFFNWKRMALSSTSIDCDDTEQRVAKRSRTSSDVPEKEVEVIQLSDDESNDDSSTCQKPLDAPSCKESSAEISDDEDVSVVFCPTPPASKDNSPEFDTSTDQLAAAYQIELSDVKTFVSRYDNVPQPPGMPPWIGGTPVKFPVENSPYKSQISVMHSVIQGCKNGQNCLIESPTGSGKTLALLCSALAWQQQEKGRGLVEKYEQCQRQPIKPDGFKGEYERPPNQDVGADVPVPGKAEGCEKDVFEPAQWEDAPKKEKKIPKIFYCTRTHKQLEQVVSELKKTVYRDVGMTILSSREHTCLRPKEEGLSKTQLCNNLLDPQFKESCQYYSKESKDPVWDELASPWDIEDLVEFGLAHRSCPYFAARRMVETADLVLCPYNYLIDPVIRSSMKIDLKGHVVIVDEAHNIENISRDIASTSFREDSLAEVADDCRTVHRITGRELYQDLQNYVEALLSVVQDQKLEAEHPADVNGEVTSVWLSGQDAWTQLAVIHRLGDARYQQFRAACQSAFEAYTQMKENLAKDEKQQAKTKKREMSTISFVTKRLLEELLMSLSAIQDLEYRNDFRVMTAMAYHRDAKVRVQENTWVAPKEKRTTMLRTLKFLCMNSAMIFRQVSSICHCMVLASGTLTPTSTFESELGTNFKYKLHASHVITRDQVYVRVIPRGPTGMPIKAIYSNVQKLPFKDELGLLLKEVSQTVPHGILCFFSSYNVMNEMMERWKTTGTWDDIEAVKRTIIEPRFSNQIDEVMKDYRDAIRETGDGPDQFGVTGAIMFAVLRGKVAEGIDFSDNEARCVLTIGIPYPSLNDAQVKMKKEYNDKHQFKGLLKGSDWYNIQAYRALNQALGRCIRHRNDWGAILLVDERLLSMYSSNYLPKWIREMTLKDGSYNLKNELKQFVEDRKQNAKDVKKIKLIDQ